MFSQHKHNLQHLQHQVYDIFVL